MQQITMSQYTNKQRGRNASAKKNEVLTLKKNGSGQGQSHHCVPKTALKYM